MTKFVLSVLCTVAFAVGVFDDYALRFAFIPVLNISFTGDTERFTNWQTTAAGVVKLARGPNGEVLTLEHDACGRVVQRTVARNGFRPQTWRFGWNAQDQMIRADCPDGDVWTYAYDPFGRRVSKACKHTQVTFIWDGDVIAREITEARGEVQTVDWFFEPGSFRPMARLERGDLTYVINDHLGTPKEVVGGDGGLRWSADHDTWGTLRTKRGAAAEQLETGDYWVQPTSFDENTAKAYEPNPDALYCPIRFRGQWQDAESGLNYNRFRYYDPCAICYLSSDPIGINGGYRPDSYVQAPSIWTDVFGLAPFGSGKGTHRAKVRVCDENGNLKYQGEFESGNMTPEEQALGFPRNTLATHTEYRAVNQVPLDPGDTMIIEGQYPPCNSCKGQMNTAAGAAGATIHYLWNEGGQLLSWAAGCCKTSPVPPC